MRILGPLMGTVRNNNARAPQRGPGPFQMLLPLELRNFVSNKSERSNDLTCLQDMAVMFACLKKNEFNQAKCSVEVESFQKCYTAYKSKKDLLREHSKKGILIPGEKKLTYGQVNKLLRAFPAKTRFHKVAEP